MLLGCSSFQGATVDRHCMRMKTMSLKLFRAIMLLPALFGFVGVAIAETKATLHSGVKGRAGVDRNRLILSNTMPDGRAVMFVIGCRANEHDALAIVVDFGAGAIWKIEGEDVTVVRTPAGTTTHRMSTSDDMLTLGGTSAIEVARHSLAADTVTFTVRGTISASFNLKAVARHVGRFRPLCSLG